MLRSGTAAFGSEDAKRRYLPKLASGEEIWCQLFSEPAGVPTSRGCAPARKRKATTGSSTARKIWTSGAHYSDYGLLITRTDPNVPKHKGLTMFFLDMKSPALKCADQAGQRHAGNSRGLFHDV